MTGAFHKLLIPRDVAATIRGLHPQLKKKLRAAFQTISSDPAAGKALVDELAGLRSYRVSRFRIIYRQTSGQIEIIAVGPRDRIYEATYRLVRKAKEE
jgi:mRNA interferase RelE/StbE